MFSFYKKFYFFLFSWGFFCGFFGVFFFFFGRGVGGGGQAAITYLFVSVALISLVIYL